MRFGGSDYHSGIINDDGSVTSDHDLLKPKTTTLEDEQNAPSTTGGTTTTLYRRDGQDKRIDVKSGTVSNGVRTITKDEANKIRKQNNLQTSDLPQGVLNWIDYVPYH